MLEWINLFKLSSIRNESPFHGQRIQIIDSSSSIHAHNPHILWKSWSVILSHEAFDFSLVTKHHRHHNADSTRYLLWPTMSIYFFNFPFHSPYVCVLMLSRTFSTEWRWIDGEWRVNKTTTASHRFRSIGLGEKFCSKLIGNILRWQIIYVVRVRRELHNDDDTG